MGLRDNRSPMHALRLYAGPKARQHIEQLILALTFQRHHTQHQLRISQCGLNLAFGAFLTCLLR